MLTIRGEAPRTQAHTPTTEAEELALRAEALATQAGASSAKAQQKRAPGMSISVFSRTMLVRTFRVIKMDSSAFREIAGDRSATLQALTVVLLAAVATVVGTLDEEGAAALGSLPRQLFLAYVGWVTGTLLVYAIAKTLLRAPNSDVEWAAVARFMGYAHAPALLRVIAVLPGIGLATAVLTMVWQGFAMLVGIKEVFGYKTYWRPLGIMAIGFAPYVAVVAGFNLLL